MTVIERERAEGHATEGHRLEAAGFLLAEQVVSPRATSRLVRDEAFRQRVDALRDMMRPHVFPDRASRKAACRGLMPRRIFALRSTTADAQRPYSDEGCPYAIGPRIDEPGFEAVASAIVDFEVRKLVGRCASEDFRKPPASPSARSVVLAVCAAFYQLRLVAPGQGGVEGMAPFREIPADEVARTTAWILRRFDARARESDGTRRSDGRSDSA